MKPSLKNETISWWNKLVKSEELPLCNNPSNLPPISSITHLFSALNPLFTLVCQEADNSQEIWKLIYKILKKIFPVDEIPDPLFDFNSFAEYLFLKKDVLIKNNPDLISNFISCFSKNKTWRFMCWKIPESINDPELYLRALNVMISEDNSYLKRYLFVYGSTDMFIDRIEQLMSPNNPRISVLAIEFMSKLVKEKLFAIFDSPNTVGRLWSKILKNMKSKNIELSVTSFRALIAILLNTQSIYSSNHFNEWLMMFLESIPSSSCLHNMSIKFLLDLKISDFPYIDLAKHLLTPSNISVESFKSIRELCLLSWFEKGLNVLQMLFSVALNNKLWSETATTVLLDVLPNYMDKSSVIAWLNNIIRRCFLFLGAAFLRNKYVKRRVLILSIFSTLYKLKKGWFCKNVMRLFSSLVNQKICLKSESSIPCDKITDFKFISEVEHASARKSNLKLMLISSADNGIVLPLSQRSKSSVTKIQTFKPAAVKLPSAKKTISFKKVTVNVSSKKCNIIPRSKSLSCQ